MLVGICRLVLSLPGNDSLKGKRSVVRRIVERARSRFNVAMAEVGHLDAHKLASLGFAVVSNDARHAQSMLDTIVSFVAGATSALIVDRQVEVVTFGEHFGLEGPLDHG